MKKIITDFLEYEVLPRNSPNYYGMQIHIHNINEGDYLWLDDNRHAKIYSLVSKSLDADQKNYTLIIKSEDQQTKTVKCDKNTTISINTNYLKI
jgi:hypothetical protein